MGGGWQKLITLDHNPECKPDVVHDLMELPYPFEDNTFDEIHAYEVLEHTGRQGDYKFFFAQWFEFWRILKNGGTFHATVPALDSPWLWGDPSHTRVICRQSLVFLDQDQYKAQLGKTAMTDFRNVWEGHFKLVEDGTAGGTYVFTLRAIK